MGVHENDADDRDCCFAGITVRIGAELYMYTELKVC
jgi:hypothetical protein